jgi:hypothetical protein
MQMRISPRIAIAAITISLCFQAGVNAQKTIVDQSISGGVYKNSAGHFTLTVPEGWRTNDDIVEPKLGIGGLTSPDNEANLEIQQMPTEDIPAAFAKKIDAKGSSVFPGYRKLDESKLDVAGRNCEVLTFAWVQERQVAGAPVKSNLVSRFVLIPNEHSIFAFQLVAREPLFDKEMPAFEQIVKSFHSTAQEDFSRKPK